MKPSSIASTIPDIDLINVNELITSSKGGASGTIDEGSLVSEVSPGSSSTPKFDFHLPKNQTHISSLMSLASSIPSFLHPFTITSFVNKPSVVKMTDEEEIDKYRTYILEGLH
ncbi:unnamed protein product [Lactuca virosa]|uniref:Uncharacterized protein n=1 Tax=Lactuca virosa TaxID=75947 RepID=A0AAU9PAM1_9ASTR|nr:unnamed protein product [Lactuca virosa]